LSRLVWAQFRLSSFAQGDEERLYAEEFTLESPGSATRESCEPSGIAAQATFPSGSGSD
tara:strand:+ start:628 stop:804 length:177 start_codon:yes stop_codon:yes gene_type:complete